MQALKKVSKTASEDEMDRTEKQIQKITEDMTKQLTDGLTKKEKEILADS